MARIVRFHETGGPDVLRIEEVDVPPPGPGEVRIAVKALGLNRAESMFRSGHYLDEPKLPLASATRRRAPSRRSAKACRGSKSATP